jgi:UDP-N-acetylglucosamine diphosphorylase / glucose-1-phosphate thymidylyltransferase / UDP-N-acetylgalactosamine diphosphorylase / glucosamine-1-phosphate N-acetyltransferase / galactosamine-1-phosphate N-acetyltransferase
MSDIVGLIPAAGSGTRMYPFSKSVPKELYPVLGKSVIEHTIENLKVGGVDNIYLVVGHQKGALMDYVGDGSFFGVRAAYIYQLKRRGIGHAILQAENWIGTTFVVMLGDSFIEPKTEIKELIDLHKKENALATLMLFKVPDPSGYGVVKFKSLDHGHGEVEKLVEKPDRETAKGFGIAGDYYAICGAYVFDRRIFEFIRKTRPGVKGEVQITDAIDLARRSGEKIMGMVLKGKYLDIGKWDTVLKVSKEMFHNSDIDASIKERTDMAEKMKEAENDS